MDVLFENFFNSESLIGAIISGLIFGWICKGISERRGMEGGFWWGFFLWLIGVIIVAVRPKDEKSQESLLDNTTHIFFCPNCKKAYSGLSAKNNTKCLACGGMLMETTVLADTWRSYSEFTKDEMKRAFMNGQYLRNDNVAPRFSTSPSPASGADEIKKYKELMDSGIITQEEFEAKKKQILGL